VTFYAIDRALKRCRAS